MLQRRFFKIVIAILSFLFIFIVNNKLFAQVDPSGNFNTSIPIKIPAGANGMHPALNLNYNSNGGNGMLGAGWSLNGIPFISRIPYDDKVNYNGNDTYAGPEGRLVDVSGNKSFYYPEQENWTKYVTYGTQGDGPLYWIAYTNGGRKYYYGYIDNSRVMRIDPINGEKTDNVRTWALTKVEDVHGNFYEIEYDLPKSFTNGNYTDLQAENAILTGDAAIKTESTGSPSEGNSITYVLLKHPGSVEFTINSDGEGMAIIKYRYRIDSDRTALLVVNGVLNVINILKTYEPNATPVWGTQSVNVSLKRGLNTVCIQTNGVNFGRLDKIQIPSTSTTGAYYPMKITYTKRDDNLISKHYSIKFQYEVRNDIKLSLNSGKVIYNKLLTSISVRCETELVRKYVLSYDYGRTSKQSRLIKVQEYGSDSTSALPAKTFTYSDSNLSWTQNTDYEKDFPNLDVTTFQGTGERINSSEGRQFMDLNGDGLVDIAWNNLIVNGGARINTGSGWQINSDFIPPADLFADITNNPGSQGYRTVDKGVRFSDLNGDGLVDIIKARRDRNNTTKYHNAWINTGTSWLENPDFKLPIVPETGIPLSFIDDVFWGATYPQRTNSANGVHLIDVNSDGFPDLVYAKSAYDHYEETKIIYKNYIHTWINKGKGDGTPSSAWELQDQWALPVPVLKDSMEEDDPYYDTTVGLGAQFEDVNGDGYVDIVKAHNGSRKTYLNNKNGWTLDADYALPVDFSERTFTGDGNRTNSELGGMFVDVNGDGLIDVVYGRKKGTDGTSSKKTWLNTGSGWLEWAAYVLPSGMELVQDTFQVDNTGNDPNKILLTSDRGVRFYDINEDGLVDLLRGYDDSKGSTVKIAYRNTGEGWVRDDTLKPIWVFVLGRYKKVPCESNIDKPGSDTNGVHVMDLNGDGLLDYIKSYKDENGQYVKQIKLRNGMNPDLLLSIDNGMGGEMGIEYTPMTRIKGVIKVDINNQESIHAPSKKYVVTKLSQYDYTKSFGNSNDDSSDIIQKKILASYSESFQYYNPRLRRSSYRASYINAPPRIILNTYLGFEKFTKINDQTGIRMEMEFLQNWPFHGKPSINASYTKNNTILSKEIFGEYKALKFGENGLVNGDYDVYYYDELNCWIRNDLYYSKQIQGFRNEKENYDTGYLIYKAQNEIKKIDNYGNVTESVTLIKNKNDAVIKKLSSNASYINSILQNRFISIPYYTESLINDSIVVSRERLFYDGKSLGQIGELCKVSQKDTFVGECADNGGWVSSLYEYDTVGNLVKETGFDGLSVFNEYDNEYKKYPVKVTDKFGLDTYFTYDERYDIPVEAINSDKLHLVITLDSLGRTVKTEQKGPEGIKFKKSEILYIIDRANGGENSVRNLTYSDIANNKYLVSEIFKDGLDREYLKKSGSSDPGGITQIVKTEYDIAGRVLRTSLPYSVNPRLWNVNAYDEYGRLRKIEYADGRIEVYEYFNDSVIFPEKAVNTSSVTYWETDAVWKKRRTFYDFQGKVLKEIQGITNDNPAGVSLDFTYNNKEELIKVTGPAANGTTADILINYDFLGRKTEINDPNAGTVNYYYNTAPYQGNFGQICEIVKPAPNTEKQLDPPAISIKKFYDNFGREIKVELYNENDQKTKETIVSYTPQNRIDSSSVIEDGYTVSNSFNYDIFGNTIFTQLSITDPSNSTKSFSFRSEYDELGRCVKQYFPDVYNLSGSAKLYEAVYREDGYLEKIKYDDEIYASYDYNAELGVVDSINYKNGVISSFSYDDTARLKNAKTQKGNTRYLDYSYNYYKSNLVKDVVDNVNTARSYQYEYDNLDRLIKAVKNPSDTLNKKELIFDFDDAGNIIFKSRLDENNNIATNNLTYTTGTHQLASDGTNNYKWSASGNMLSKGSNIEYHYTVSNMLKDVYKNGSLIEKNFYAYGEDRIVKIHKKNPQTEIKTYYIAGGMYEIRERWENGSLKGAQKTMYLSGLAGHRLTSITVNDVSFGDPEEKNTSSGLEEGLYFYHQNYLNSASLVTDEQGNKKTFYQYQPFGGQDDFHTEHFGAEETETTTYKFTGQEYDAETGLYNFNARFYDPEIGIFTTADTIIPNERHVMSYNRYMYCFGNPVNLTDPNGHNPPPPPGAPGQYETSDDFVDAMIKWWDDLYAYYSNPDFNLSHDEIIEKVTDAHGDYWCQQFGVNSTGQSTVEPENAHYFDLMESEFDQWQYDSFDRYVVGHKAESFIILDLGGNDQIASIVLGCLPVVGELKDLQEVITGYDLVTGEKLSILERGITAGAILLPIISGSALRNVDEAAEIPGLADEGAEVLGLTDEVQDTAKSVDLFEPGPYAGESISARSADQTFTAAERSEINRIGYDTGCHSCGTTNPGTKSGNFVPDHQPVSSLNTSNLPQDLYPQCIDCSRKQGLEAARRLREME